MDNFMLIAILFFLLFGGCLIGYWRITGRIIKDQEEEIERLKRENNKLKTALKSKGQRQIYISSSQSGAYNDEIEKALYNSRGIIRPQDFYYGDF